jgi:outer membrane protein
MAVFNLKNARALVLAGVVLSVSAGAVPAFAESLLDSLASAYATNPTIKADRARQRGTDEQVPQALSGWRPTITANASAAHEWTDSDVSDPASFDPLNVNIALSQPLFRGFKTVNGVAAAEASVLAGRQNLLAIEQGILFSAIQAYADVVRDRRIVALRTANVGVLQRQAKAAAARFAVGEVTRTDVAQARARVSQSQASLSSAKASLNAACAKYHQLIGKNPGNLKVPAVAKLPKSLQTALSQANEINPNILSAALVQEIAGYNIEIAKGDLMPSLSLEASASLTGNPNSSVDWASEEKVGLQLSVPLYNGGRTYSGVREAKQVESQRTIQIIETGRAVREAVTRAWGFVSSAREAIVSAKAQVASTALALDGVRQEYLVGSRTTLDVLNAEQEVLNARISLVSDERDLVVASYQVLASIGKLTARHLGLNVSLYDPEDNYIEVRDKWIGLDANTVE